MSESDFASCSTCRTPIRPGDRYFRCSVSTCNLGKQKLRFCSRKCWEDHVPTARHRQAKCIEETAPKV
jgi:hypothetical protein